MQFDSLYMYIYLITQKLLLREVSNKVWWGSQAQGTEF